MFEKREQAGNIRTLGLAMADAPDSIGAHQQRALATRGWGRVGKDGEPRQSFCSRVGGGGRGMHGAVGAMS